MSLGVFTVLEFFGIVSEGEVLVLRVFGKIPL